MSDTHGKHIDQLDSSYIRAWCEEWELDQSDFKIMWEAYAEGEHEEAIVMFMSDLARLKRRDLHRRGKLIYLEEFISMEDFSAQCPPFRHF